MITINQISNSLAKNELVAFIGAGVSKGNEKVRGIPTASEFVKIFANEFDFIKEDNEYKRGSLRFEIACKKIKNNVGFGKLVDIICRETDNPFIRPLPAHKILAKLPFCAYFTTNFDTLLEQAYSEITDKYQVIIDDKDVPFLKPSYSPIIKLHGSICRKESIIASIDDYKAFKNTKPLVDSLAKVNLACKQILFLGFSLSDPDFLELHDEIRSLLGSFMVPSLAVVNGATQEDKYYWHERGITLINEDLTDFLNRLALLNSSVSQYIANNINDKSSYIMKLHEITDCPTETIATDVFLKILLEEVNSELATDIIINEFKKGFKAVMVSKPNFLAFEHDCKALVKKLEKCQNKDQMLQIVRRKIESRVVIGNKINYFSSQIFKPSSQILVYSQSIRVIEILKSLSFEIQKSCMVYISECRAKSPSPFYDAIQIYEQLESTKYKKVLITDSSISYLMKTNQVNCVIMGAHAVYTENGIVSKFVNTSGSQTIVTESNKYNIPIYLIAEKAKIKKWSKAAENETRYEEGNYITNVLSSMSSRPATIEVAYDLCEMTPNITFVSEGGLNA